MRRRINPILLLLPTLIALSTSLSLPTSVNSTRSYPRPQSNDSMPTANWPSAPYRVKIATDTYLIIDHYMPPARYDLLPYILTNITSIIHLLEDSGDVNSFVDNSRVFSSGHVWIPLSDLSTGLVSVRFPAVLAKENPALPRITVGMAVRVLRATWLLEHNLGPTGFSFAMIERGGKPWSKFSLWFSQLKRDQYGVTI